MSANFIQRRFCWKPELPDHRDKRYLVFAGAPLPKFVNKLGARNPIENQAELGSCTGNSSTSALEITLGTDVQYSRLMAYYNARTYEGTTKIDNGAEIRSVIKGLMKIGVSTEQTWPYKIKKFKTAPSTKAYSEARALVGSLKDYEYARVKTLTEMKSALANGWPVTFGFVVTNDFMTLDGDYFLKVPKPTDRIEGGHAVCAVGYDDRGKKPFIWVRNSWGAEWGLDGYFKMDQSWFLDQRQIADDMWVIRPKAKR